MTEPTNITFFIDLQNGFANPTLDANNLGGSLYVPEGEKSGTVANEIISQDPDGYYIFTQDYHPANHISFMTNHPGVMAMRERVLDHTRQPRSEIMNPLVLPFNNILIDKNGEVIGVLDGPPDTDPEILLFAVTDNRITGERGVVGVPGDVPGGFLNAHLAKGATIQTLWKAHCVQGSFSAEFVPEIANFINPINQEIAQDTPHYRFRNSYVLRKGMNPEVDSYGAGRENDQKSETTLRIIANELAQELKDKGVTEVNLNIGGLATNFCAEFSNTDIHDIVVPIFAEYGVKANVRFISDLSYGIPINSPNGQWPDLATAESRMIKKGSQVITSDTLIAELSRTRPDSSVKGNLTATAYQKGREQA